MAGRGVLQDLPAPIECGAATRQRTFCLLPAAIDGRCYVHHTAGFVATEESVAQAMLDLVGFSGKEPDRRLLDPGCGDGVLIGAALERRLTALEEQGEAPRKIAAIARREFRGIELQPTRVSTSRRLVQSLLVRREVGLKESRSVARKVIQHTDFLLTNPGLFDVIIANPPYVPSRKLSTKYREQLQRLFETFQGRSNLFVAFLEAILDALPDGGAYAVLCPDRLGTTEFAAPIRESLKKRSTISHIFEFANDPFVQSVKAYPWLIAGRIGGQSRAIQVARFDQKSPQVFRTLEPAMLNGIGWSPFSLANASSSKGMLGLLPGLALRTGVATGRDAVFVDPVADLEEELLVPLIMNRDLHDGATASASSKILNPWNRTGPRRFLDLKNWPKAAKYFAEHQKELSQRYVAKKSPGSWYRTIDAIDYSMVSEKKLVIPVLRNEVRPYLTPGHEVVHHNCVYLYRTTNQAPALEAIGAILRSKRLQELARAVGTTFNNGSFRLTNRQILRLPMPDIDWIREHHKELASSFLGARVEEIDNLLSSYKW